MALLKFRVYEDSGGFRRV